MLMYLFWLVVIVIAVRGVWWVWKKRAPIKLQEYWKDKIKGFNECLETNPIVGIFKNIGYLGIVFAIILFGWEWNDRDFQRKSQAWNLVYLASGHGGDGGRIEALEYLKKKGSDFSGINLSKAVLDGIDLSGAILKGVDFKFASLVHADLSGANLQNCDFHFTDLSNANLENADIEGAKIYVTNLTGVDLKGINYGYDNKWILPFNVYDVKNPPEGFHEWCKKNECVEHNAEKWKKIFDKKRKAYQDHY